MFQGEYAKIEDDWSHHKCGQKCQLWRHERYWVLYQVWSVQVDLTVMDSFNADHQWVVDLIVQNAYGSWWNPLSEYEEEEDGPPVLVFFPRPRSLFVRITPFFTRDRCNLMDLKSLWPTDPRKPPNFYTTQSWTCEAADLTWASLHMISNRMRLFMANKKGESRGFKVSQKVFFFPPHGAKWIISPSSQNDIQIADIGSCKGCR